MKKQIIIYSLFTLCVISLLLMLPVSGWSQSADLQEIETDHVKVFYSNELKSLAEERLYRLNRANKFIAEYLGTEIPAITLYVLSEKDWETDKISVPYGLVHYTGRGRIVSGTGQNEFFDMFKLNPDEFSGGWQEMYLSAYVDEDGNNSIIPYINTIIFHELAHAFYEGRTINESINMQRYWLMDIFCSLFAQFYFEEDFRSSLRDLTLFAVQLGVSEREITYTGLADYEQYNGTLEPFNYAWYRFRFQHAAQVLYRHADEDVLLRLYNFLKNTTGQLSDEELLEGLEKNVDPIFAELIRDWNVY